MTTSPDPTTRFSGRVADYALYRPKFPEELLDLLPAGTLPPDGVAADIGSGTGIFSGQLARRVGALHCVEPNREMREYSMEYLREFRNVRIAAGSAEATGLPDACVDVVTAAQAFHWFDREKTKIEFRRILRTGGRVVLLWYERVTTGDPFLGRYEELLQEYSIDYQQVDHRNVTPEIIAGFFHPNPVDRAECAMTEVMDLPAIRGRIASSSYTPPAGHPNHVPLMDAVTELFHRCQRAGSVDFRYRTIAHTGLLSNGTTPARNPRAGAA